MNLVVLTGNLARDPEKSMTGSGMTVARFTIAVNRFSKKEGQPEADFIRVTVFDRQADLVMQYLSKGRKVGVEGRIQTGSYTDKDGKKVYTTDVIANRVEFLDPKGGAGLGGGGGSDWGGQFENRSSGDFAAAPPAYSAPAPAPAPAYSAPAPSGGSADAGAPPTGFAELDDDDMPF